MMNWFTPTLDPAELDKRISELKTVQFWLEQHNKGIAAAIQTLEVQKMTLATLHTMHITPEQAAHQADTRAPMMQAWGALSEQFQDMLSGLKLAPQTESPPPPAPVVKKVAKKAAAKVKTPSPRKR